LLFAFLPLLPFLERDEEKGAVARARKAEETEARDTGSRLHARRVRQNVLNRLDSSSGPLKRRCWRKLQVHENLSLVLIRQKAGRQPCGKESPRECAHQQHGESNHALAHQAASDSYISFGSATENTIEPVEKAAQQAATGFARAQQQSRKRGA